jgi:hypothetical protein
MFVLTLYLEKRNPDQPANTPPSFYYLRFVKGEREGKCGNENKKSGRGTL